MNQEEFETGVIRPVECYREGWNAIKDQYWILFAVTIVGMILGGITLYILLGAVVCGIFKCFFNVFDGEKAELETVFKSFKYFKPSLPVVVLIVVPMLLVFGSIYAPVLYATFMGARMTEEELFSLLTGTLIIEFIVATVMVCLHTLLMFAFPLIVDRNMSGWQAIKTSARAVWKNMSGVAGLWAVGFVISLLGLLVFCFGTYLTMPIIIAGNIAAYRKVFPKPKI
jgi:hypothetical protein